MSERQNCRINISAPNLVSVCVDRMCGEELSGRIYHCYNKEPIPFTNVVKLLMEMERLFDQISFPQASTKSRNFVECKEIRIECPEKIVEQEELLKHKGELGTFVTHVRMRQKSTWQGETFWMENKEQLRFMNTLEFIKGISNSLQEK